MRPPKTLCRTVLLAILPSLTGCHSWHQIPPQDLTVERLEGVNRLRLATADGWEGELWGPRLQDSLLVGEEWSSTPSQYREILITSLQNVEERRMNVGATLAMSAVVVGAGFGLFVWLVHSILDDAFDELRLPSGG